MTTYELNEGQYNDLMRRLGEDYASYNDLVARVPGNYTVMYVVNGESEAQRDSRGMAAVRGNGQGAIASVREYTAEGQPARYIVNSDDSEVRRVMRDMNVRGTEPSLVQEMREVARHFSREQIRLSNDDAAREAFGASVSEMRNLLNNVDFTRIVTGTGGYELTPEQYNELFRRLNEGRGVVEAQQYTATDDLVVHQGMEGRYSGVTIHGPGQPRGANVPDEETAASVEAYMNEFTGQPERYVIRDVHDSTITRHLREMGIQQRSGRNLLQQGRDIVQQMSPAERQQMRNVLDTYAPRQEGRS